MTFSSRFLQILKRSGLLLLLLMVAGNYLEQLLTNQLENELQSMSGASGMIWVYGALSVAISLIEPAVVVILAIAALSPEPLLQNLKQQWSPVFRESMRASGIAVAWGLLLILPGLVRFIQFSFVPFIVMRDPAYAAGKIDVLKVSTKLVNRRFLPVLFLVILFTAVIPFLSTLLDEWTVFSDHPITAIALSGIDVLASVLSFLLIFKQWEKSHVTDVQLARS